MTTPPLVSLCLMLLMLLKMLYTKSFECETRTYQDVRHPTLGIELLFQAVLPHIKVSQVLIV